jgi:hypothetical protein
MTWTPGRFRGTTGNIHVELIAACRVFSAYLRSPGLSYLLQSMSCALKVGRLNLANRSIEFDMEFPHVCLR